MTLPSNYTSSPLIDQLFSSKIRLKLLVRLLLNPSRQVYLRQLERDLNVSSNTVRLELNKLSEMKLISMVGVEESKIKKYIANTFHPLYSSLRSIILKYVGVVQLLERAENLLNIKIRIAIYSKREFNLELLEEIQHVSICKSEMGGG